MDKYEIFKRIQPKEYMKRFLDENMRPDGRTHTEFRKTMITSGAIHTANSSAMVRLGGTTVVCGIKAEVCEPQIDIPNEGYLVPNVELSPLCSSKFKSGAPSMKAQVVSELIHELFINSHIFPLSSLCIEEGKAVWVLYADIVCLNYDGNIIDASILALTTALRDSEVSPSMVVEADSTLFTDIPLSRFPVSTTFCVFNHPDIIVSDPNETEESLAEETVTIIMDTDYHLCKIYKNGGIVVGMDEIQACIKSAKERTNEIKSLIQSPPII
ncbi:exosome complex component RRP43-like protein [Pilobolus umbonatus]|nr:exosome complex component RRP43-like protein [Pilobolus umbonatus]